MSYEITSIALTQFQREVLEELANATEKFPTWPKDPLHSLAVINEEVGELSKAVLQQVYEPHKNKNGVGDVRCELIQAAAMIIRFAYSLEHGQYTWARSSMCDQDASSRIASPNFWYE